MGGWCRLPNGCCSIVAYILEEKDNFGRTKISWITIGYCELNRYTYLMLLLRIRLASTIIAGGFLYDVVLTAPQWTYSISSNKSLEVLHFFSWVYTWHCFYILHQFDGFRLSVCSRSLYHCSRLASVVQRLHDFPVYLIWCLGTNRIIGMTKSWFCQHKFFPLDEFFFHLEQVHHERFMF